MAAVIKVNLADEGRVRGGTAIYIAVPGRHTDFQGAVQ
jgi:hypothetical protein